jgi:hypothetical protein
MNGFFMGVIVPWSILLPLLFGIYKYRALSQPGKILLFYVMATGLINVAASVVGKVYHANNLPLLHFLTVIECFFFVGFYRKLLFSNTVPLGYRLLPWLFLLLCIGNAIYFQSVFAFNTYVRSIEALIVMLLAVNYFARLAISDVMGRVLVSPNFWFNTGIFLYFSSSFTLFNFANFTIEIAKKNFFIVWTIHAALVLLMYILFTIGFVKCKK